MYVTFLIFLTGTSTNSRKVIEFGGNTLGFGSKSVLGAGWPKDILRVDGDTVTIVFEVRSGREHNTPDKAVWGFKINIRAQEQEDTTVIKPYMADIAFTALNLMSCNLQVRHKHFITLTTLIFMFFSFSMMENPFQNKK